MYPIDQVYFTVFNIMGCGKKNIGRRGDRTRGWSGGDNYQIP